MAKGNSNRGNAHGTPSSLTSLLAQSNVQTAIQQQVLTVQQIWNENQSFFDPDRKIGYRKPHPDWDNQTARKIKKRLDGDRRRYQPNRHYQPAHSIISDARRLMHGNLLPSFRLPNYVSICLRRKVRREVYLAFNKGKGSGRPRRRNHWSSIKC